MFSTNCNLHRESKILENRKKKAKGKGKVSAEDAQEEDPASVMRLRENIVSDLCRIPEKGILKKATLEREGSGPINGSQRSLASQRSQQSQNDSLTSQKSQSHSQHGSLGSQRSQRSQGSVASQRSQGSPYRSQGSPYKAQSMAVTTRGTLERHPDDYLDRRSQSSSDIGNLIKHDIS